jgi:hypothetical protein
MPWEALLVLNSIGDVPGLNRTINDEPNLGYRAKPDLMIALSLAFE